MREISLSLDLSIYDIVRRPAGPVGLYSTYGKIWVEVAWEVYDRVHELAFDPIETSVKGR